MAWADHVHRPYYILDRTRRPDQDDFACLPFQIGRFAKYIHNNTANLKKSNVEKVTGHLPDLGEFLGLIRLSRMCEDIQGVYEHGAEVTIASDGAAFNGKFATQSGLCANLICLTHRSLRDSKRTCLGL